MTQMLLFDSSDAKTVTISPVAGNSAAAPRAEVGEASGKNVAAQLDHQSGLHQMGDLARLVLLRYELVAKRRALLAARKAANSC